MLCLFFDIYPQSNFWRLLSGLDCWMFFLFFQERSSSLWCILASGTCFPIGKSTLLRICHNHQVVFCATILWRSPLCFQCFLGVKLKRESRCSAKPSLWVSQQLLDYVAHVEDSVDKNIRESMNHILSKIPNPKWSTQSNAIDIHKSDTCKGKKLMVHSLSRCMPEKVKC